MSSHTTAQHRQPPRHPRHLGAALLLSALSLSGLSAAHAYTEQERSPDGPFNDAISLAESVGTLSTGSALSIQGSRLTDGGGSSADFFRFHIDSPMWVTLSLTVPDVSNQPVLGLFDSTGPGTGSLLASAADDNSTNSTQLSFAQELTHAGDYYAAVTGFCKKGCGFDGGGDAGWTYTLNLHNTVPIPVPEPYSLAMMLSGIGMLGMLSRRRLLRQGDL